MEHRHIETLRRNIDRMAILKIDVCFLFNQELDESFISAEACHSNDKSTIDGFASCSVIQELCS